MSPIDRRRFLSTAAAAAAAPVLPGCSTPLPPMNRPETEPRARARLAACAAQHGDAAFRELRDINLSYSGEWRALIDRLQPDLVDAGFRAGSQERLLPGQGLLAQTHTGPKGQKQVLRRVAGNAGTRGAVNVWFNGQESAVREARDAAALVCDGYLLFLLGPIEVMRRVEASAAPAVEWLGTQAIGLQECDIVQVRLTPGIGLSAADQIALYIGQRDAVMHRIRFSLDGLESTQGAIAEVDTFDHLRRHGVLWPTRFYERLVRPIPAMPVHDWRLTGLDVNRGWDAEAISGTAFTGAAAAPAKPL